MHPCIWPACISESYSHVVLFKMWSFESSYSIRVEVGSSGSWRCNHDFGSGELSAITKTGICWLYSFVMPDDRLVEVVSCIESSHIPVLMEIVVLLSEWVAFSLMKGWVSCSAEVSLLMAIAFRVSLFFPGSCGCNHDFGSGQLSSVNETGISWSHSFAVDDMVVEVVFCIFGSLTWDDGDSCILW